MVFLNIRQFRSISLINGQCADYHSGSGIIVAAVTYINSHNITACIAGSLRAAIVLHGNSSHAFNAGSGRNCHGHGVAIIGLHRGKAGDHIEIRRLGIDPGDLPDLCCHSCIITLALNGQDNTVIGIGSLIAIVLVS